MDNLFGLVGDGYVLIAADCTAARSIIAYKHDEDKIRPLDAHKIVGAAGPQADTVRFVEYIQRNMALNHFRTGLTLSVKATSAYIRTELAKSLRKNPYQVNMLIGGVDADGPALVFMDYLASAAAVNYGAQGYAGYFVSSLLDRYWSAGLSREAGLDLAKKCILEIRTRMVVSSPRFVIKIVDAAGIHTIWPDAPAPAPAAAAAAGDVSDAARVMELEA